MSITILHHKYRRLLLGILYIVMGTIRYQIYNRIACDDSVSDWYKINLGSSVGTFSLFTLRVWTPFHTNKQLPHAKPLYITELYIWQAWAFVSAYPCMIEIVQISKWG